jgi:hypothetical protein
MGRAQMARISLWLAVIGLVAALPLLLWAVLAIWLSFGTTLDVVADLAFFWWLSPPLLLSALINGVLARREGKVAWAGILLATGTGMLLGAAYFLASAEAAALQAAFSVH